MKTLLLFLFLSTAAFSQDFSIIRGTISERFVRDGNTIITVHAQEQGKLAWFSATFIIDDVCNYYRVKNEYVFLLEVNHGTYDFNYNFIRGIYSPRQTREIIEEYNTQL